MFQLIRRVSIYPTWVLLHFPISANGVTLIGILLGIVSAALFAAGMLVSAVVVLQLATILDFSDGEVARYRKQQSKQGSYLDRAYHFLVHPSVFAGLAIAAHRAYDSQVVLVIGFVSTVGVPAFTMVTAYANELAVWKHARKLIGRLNGELTETPPRVDGLRALGHHARPATSLATAAAQASLARRIGGLSAIWDFPYIFLVLSIATIAEVMIGPTVAWTRSPLALVLAFYALTYPCWIALYLSHVLKTRSTERGYDDFVAELAVLVERAGRIKDR